MGNYGENYDYGMSPFYKDDQGAYGSPVIFNTVPLNLFLEVQPAVVYSFKDIDVSFTVEPQKGPAPLNVLYTANVTFKNGYGDLYNIKEYHWYFDPINNPTNYVVSLGPSINKVYVGPLGSKFSTKLCIVLEPIQG